MAERFRITQAPWLLNACGVRYHAHGTLACKDTGAKLFDYYKADSISAEQRADILRAAPYVQFFGTSPAYAPELRRVMVAFPKAAWFRQNKESMA